MKTAASLRFLPLRSGTEAVTESPKVHFIDAFEHRPHGLLDDFVFQRSDSQWPHSTVELGDPAPLGRLRPICAAVDSRVQIGVRLSKSSASHDMPSTLGAACFFSSRKLAWSSSGAMWCSRLVNRTFGHEMPPIVDPTKVIGFFRLPRGECFSHACGLRLRGVTGALPESLHVTVLSPSLSQDKQGRPPQRDVFGALYTARLCLRGRFAELVAAPVASLEDRDDWLGLTSSDSFIRGSPLAFAGAP